MSTESWKKSSVKTTTFSKAEFMKIEHMPVRRRMVVAGLAGLFAVSMTNTALAQLSLDQARNQGLVGERRNGLLGIIQNSGGVAALVERVNAERLAQYRQIADSTGAPLASVQQRAGAQLIQRARPGWFVESASGGWVQN